MEDTHVWTIEGKGGAGREVGATIDNRQGPADWSPDGTELYFTVQERGSVRLYRMPAGGGAVELVMPAADERASVGSWSVAAGGVVACTLTTPSRPAELYVKEGRTPARRLTTITEALLAPKTIAEVEGFTFSSFDGTKVEAFFTMPAGRAAGTRHPMIVTMHGGPHGQQGPGFNAKAQVYAARGWAVLMVNYRGSTGYGQKFVDAIFKDQNGGEAKDVLAGVDAALRRYPWIDPERLGLEGGSYGGQLTNWIVTRTDRFRAAIPSAGISNLVTQNYLAYYHDYLAVEFGGFPHTGRLMDLLWERSPIRYVARVRTPTMFLHGENDNDVSIAEAEQFFIALKDVGVETVMVRYPREGHGLRETTHVVDSIERSIAWYERHWK
jgi:dipeptidyl aminopeptidase/acylaminoacyl peptidase